MSNDKGLNEPITYVLVDEEGNQFSGIEVLRLAFTAEDGKDTEVLLLEDNVGTWFPFIVSPEDQALIPVDDEETLTAIEDTIGAIFEFESEGEEEADDSSDPDE